ncbi:hypothetical protein B0H13DRAFT_1863244 [Mycena leptocephala]|nr:hypothetical protein B0H13DRAFT_1863244 [Mycena leptocephala]
MSPAASDKARLQTQKRQEKATARSMPLLNGNTDRSGTREIARASTSPDANVEHFFILYNRRYTNYVKHRARIQENEDTRGKSQESVVRWTLSTVKGSGRKSGLRNSGRRVLTRFMYLYTGSTASTQASFPLHAKLKTLRKRGGRRRVSEGLRKMAMGNNDVEDQIPDLVSDDSDSDCKGDLRPAARRVVVSGNFRTCDVAQDWQRGERYKNIDFVLLLERDPIQVQILYSISCVFRERTCRAAKWNRLAHKPPCQSVYAERLRTAEASTARSSAPPRDFVPCAIPLHLGDNFTNHVDFSSKGNKRYWILHLGAGQGVYSTANVLHTRAHAPGVPDARPTRLTKTGCHAGPVPWGGDTQTERHTEANVNIKLEHDTTVNIKLERGTTVKLEGGADAEHDDSASHRPLAADFILALGVDLGAVVTGIHAVGARRTSQACGAEGGGGYPCATRYTAVEETESEGESGGGGRVPLFDPDSSEEEERPPARAPLLGSNSHTPAFLKRPAPAPAIPLRPRRPAHPLLRSLLRPCRPARRYGALKISRLPTRDSRTLLCLPHHQWGTAGSGPVKSTSVSSITRVAEARAQRDDPFYVGPSGPVQVVMGWEEATRVALEVVSSKRPVDSKGKGKAKDLKTTPPQQCPRRNTLVLFIDPLQGTSRRRCLHEIAPEKPDSHMERLQMWREARARMRREASTSVPEHKIVEELQRLLKVPRKKMHPRRRELLERLEILRKRDAGSEHDSDPADSVRSTDDLEEEMDLRETLGRDWRSCVGYL